MSNVLGIFGAGGLGREVLELAKIINKREKKWDEIVFVVNMDAPKEVNGTLVYKLDEAQKCFADKLEISIALGEPFYRDMFLREFENKSIPLATLIHPDVYIPETTRIGKGVTIQYGCLISCNVTIEDGAFIQPQANLGHDTIVHCCSTIAALANLSGNVTVGPYAYIGASASVKECVSIGEWSIVGMLSAVYKDIPSNVIALGNPARPMRKNEDRRVFK